MGKSSDDAEAESIRSKRTAKSQKDVVGARASDISDLAVQKKKQSVASRSQQQLPNIKVAPNHASTRYSSSTISSMSSIATTVPKDKTYSSARIPIPPSVEKTLYARRTENVDTLPRKSTQSGATLSMMSEKDYGNNDRNQIVSNELEVIDLPNDYVTESEADDYDRYSRKGGSPPISRSGSGKSRQSSKKRNRRNQTPREGYGAEGSSKVSGKGSNDKKSPMNPLSMLKSPYGLFIWAFAIIIIAGLSATISTVLIAKSVNNATTNGLSGSDYASTLPNVSDTSSSSITNSDTSSQTDSSSSSSPSSSSSSSSESTSSTPSSTSSSSSSTAAADAAQSSLSGRSNYYENYKRMQRLSHRPITRKRI